MRMSQLSYEISLNCVRSVKNLVSERDGVITPSLTQRSKFEGWLKWELISELFIRGLNSIPQGHFKVNHSFSLNYTTTPFYATMSAWNHHVSIH